MFGLRDHKRVGKLCSVVRLDHPNRKRRRLDKPLQKILGAVGALLCIHFPVCPPCTLILGCKLVVFLPIDYAIAGYILYVYLNLLPWIFRRLIGLVLSPLPLLLLASYKSPCRSLEASVPIGKEGSEKDSGLCKGWAD